MKPMDTVLYCWMVPDGLRMLTVPQLWLRQRRQPPCFARFIAAGEVVSSCCDCSVLSVQAEVAAGGGPAGVDGTANLLSDFSK
jgi:hypothetical protein